MLWSQWRNLLPRSDSVRTLLLFLLIFIVYMATGRVIDYGDNLPARYLPLSIIREHNFDLDEYTFLYDGKPLQGIFSLQFQNGHFISTYPVGTALAAVPFYLLPALLGVSPESPWLPYLEKLSAAAMAALSVIFLYLTLRSLTGGQHGLIIALIYGLGTTTFSMSSQGLFQHTGSQLFLSLALCLLVWGLRERRFTANAGFPLTAAVVCRPTDILIVIPLAAYVLQRRRDQLLKFLLFALPPLVLQGLYNYGYLGSFFRTGYGAEVLNPFSPSWSTFFPEGFLGLLISPRVGLFIYSPVLLFSCFGILRSWKKGVEPLFRYLSIGPVLVIILYSRWSMWWGAWNWGPRLLADLTPFLAFFLLDSLEAIKESKLLKAAFYTLAAVSISLHGLGAFSYDGNWSLGDGDGNPLWSWKGSPIVYYGGKFLDSVREREASIVRRALRLSDSRSAPMNLAATYALQNVPHSGSTSEPIGLSLKAINIGDAAWLKRTPDGRGEVHLGWRWFKDDVEVSSDSGREVLMYDVLPGREHEFALRIWPPSEPGKYLLELGLVNEHMAWFQDLGSAPLKIPLMIRGDSLCDLNAAVKKPAHPSVGSLDFIFDTDSALYKRGDLLMTRLSMSNSGIARFIRLYIILQGPNEELYFFDGGKFSPYHRCFPWVRYGIAAFIPRHFKAPAPLSTIAFGLWLKSIPPGPYRLYAIVTEPNDSQLSITAKAEASFVVQP